MSNTVLIITGDAHDAAILHDTLAMARDGPFVVESRKTLSEGVARLKQGGIDIILVDLFLADSQGIETFDTLFKLLPLVPPPLRHWRAAYRSRRAACPFGGK